MANLRVGVLGKMRSGKGTLASYLKDFDPSMVELSFAYPLKSRVLGIINDERARENLHPLTLADIERNKTVFRPILQWFGTDFWREFNGRSNYWVEQFLKEVESQTAEGNNIVVADVRFPNEVEALRDNGFILVNVIRSYDSRIKSIRDTAPGGSMTYETLQSHLNHPSETALDDYQIREHVSVFNSGDCAGLDALRNAAKSILNLQLKEV